MRALQTLFALGILAASGAEAQSLLTVRVYNYAAVPGNTLAAAEATAQAIFRRSGIEAEWLHCPTNRDEAGLFPACRKPAGPWEVVLQIVPQSMEPKIVGSDAFGLALPGTSSEPSTHAYLYYHRAEQTATESHRTARPVSLPALMAHVIVHEVGHLVLGPNMHSPRGIMRARWEARDLREMEIGAVGFPSDQAKTLRARLEERTGGQH
jgi:hypothetical protein